MKSITRVLLGTALVYLSSFVPTVSAQMPESINLNLPVAAYFGTTLVPAGHYSISQVHNNTANPTLEIESDKGVHFFLNVTRMESNNDATKTNLTLAQKNGAYRASKLEVAGSSEYFDLN